MKKKILAIWIYFITMLAGAINVYAIKMLGIPVTHHTGNLSNFSIALIEGDDLKISIILTIISFFLGSLLAGIIFQKKYKATKIYVYAFLIGGLLIIGLELIKIKGIVLSLLSLWVGLQNGMYISFSGNQVRTSHFTGYLTDAGLSIGEIITGNNKNYGNAIHFILAIFSFIFGGLLANLLFNINYPLLFIGIGYILAALFLKILNIEIN